MIKTTCNYVTCQKNFMTHEAQDVSLGAQPSKRGLEWKNCDNCGKRCCTMHLYVKNDDDYCIDCIGV